MTERLSVRDLTVEFRNRSGAVVSRPVKGVSFDVPVGTTLGIVGETGSGKTLTGMAIMGLLPHGAHAGGAVLLDGQDLMAMGEKERAAYRGRDVSFVFQNAGTAFNPCFTVGWQLGQVLRRHSDKPRRERRDLVLERLADVGLPDPRRAAGSYPHELSGGMLQRCMIAMALLTSPRLLILDEPTTALDVSVAQQVLRLVLELQEKLHLTAIHISHNLGVIGDVCDSVAVMYGGEVVEHGPAAQVLGSPAHPYTKGLLNALPGNVEPGRPLVPYTHADTVGAAAVGGAA
jgi:peptide/nickel transport system ATP-binding protein